MKNRSELPQIYIDFATMVKTQFDKIIKTLRRDNAMEYRDSKLLKFLTDDGALCQYCCPHTSQQNSCVERKLRHILNFIHSMTISSSCPERF